MHDDGSRKARIRQKLLRRFRLLIINDSTFEEKLSLKLTRLNVFVIVGFVALFFMVLTFILIAFSPLREYIPGYASTKLKNKLVELVHRTDSLSHVISLNEAYYKSIRKALKGEINLENLDRDSIVKTIKLEASQFDFTPIPEDSILRQKVDREDKYSVFESTKTRTDFVLFPPVQGVITEAYNVEQKHYAIDISVVKNTPVKAVADGVVVFSEWTVATGYVIIIEHSFGLISVYKHNETLVKNQGDLVMSGEVIAVSGDTGELSTGPHLHFELWNDGYPINPVHYIDFD